ncbi:Zip-domain-containing protein [Cucurbitaria berberidis CBS 394.84]|uniref:Zip-domain-containing protein n=1 Tax=Cucurbitaria berberidis CBS 394.84 TaxID=1168544 RepID=A0A9P4L4V8_9PLEO|nr:Zip-domain-containing protein [Cucurbitaria berberidis CBS 394.84]KAF1841714.1 Zip-domain-containing protein [Cucurbitaria berberidis CBS 394.84]
MTDMTMTAPMGWWGLVVLVKPIRRLGFSADIKVLAIFSPLQALSSRLKPLPFRHQGASITSSDVINSPSKPAHVPNHAPAHPDRLPHALLSISSLTWLTNVDTKPSVLCFAPAQTHLFSSPLLAQHAPTMETAALQVARLVLRQDPPSPETTPNEPVRCSSENDYDGRMGIRISSIFVILVGSMFGAIFPVFAKRMQSRLVPNWVFFVAKYFGSGVIVATAFIHLLAPAHEALTNECLTGVIVAYPWVEGIVLMTIFAMFFLELMTMRYATFGGGHGHSHSHSHEADHSHTVVPSAANSADISLGDHKSSPQDVEATPSGNNPHLRGEDHLGHQRDHVANSELSADWEAHGVVPETYAAQLTAVFILEFGVIFHSIFIGLTLAVAGDEFITLYIVLVFHQTFEGLGLGARLAEVPWPKVKRWTPYLLALGFGISTPIAIAIGLGVRETFVPGSRTTLLVNGVFDSISAGILIYTGLVELMAHEFMFSPYMQKGPVSRTLKAFALMIMGAGLMALLGYWA